MAINPGYFFGVQDQKTQSSPKKVSSFVNISLVGPCKPKIKTALKKCKTLETFFVFGVSKVTFASRYERGNIEQSNRNVFEPRFQKCHHG